MSTGSVRKSVRIRLIRAAGIRCVLCGLQGFERKTRARNTNYSFHTATRNVFMSIDHIIPRAKGGSDEESNLRVICTLCNSRKGIRETVDCFENGGGI